MWNVTFCHKSWKNCSLLYKIIGVVLQTHNISNLRLGSRIILGQGASQQSTILILNSPLTLFINARMYHYMYLTSNIFFSILKWYILGFVKWFQSIRGRAERTPRRDWNGRATYCDQFQCPRIGQELNYSFLIPFLYFPIYLYLRIVSYFNIIGYIL